MLKYDQTIQIRCTSEEKALFHQKGGSEAFREWLNAAPAPAKHHAACPCAECVIARGLVKR